MYIILTIGLFLLKFISQYFPSNLQWVVIGFVSVALLFIGSMVVTLFIRRFLKKISARNKDN